VISNVKDTFLRILIGLPFSLIVIADYCGVILQQLCQKIALTTKVVAEAL
jgi:hypothetical protein